MRIKLIFCILLIMLSSCRSCRPPILPTLKPNVCPAGSVQIMKQNYDTECDGNVVANIRQIRGNLKARCANVGDSSYSCRFSEPLSKMCFPNGIKSLSRDKLECNQPSNPSRDRTDGNTDAINNESNMNEPLPETQTSRKPQIIEYVLVPTDPNGLVITLSPSPHDGFDFKCYGFWTPQHGSGTWASPWGTPNTRRFGVECQIRYSDGRKTEVFDYPFQNSDNWFRRRGRQSHAVTQLVFVFKEPDGVHYEDNENHQSNPMTCKIKVYPR